MRRGSLGETRHYEKKELVVENNKHIFLKIFTAKLDKPHFFPEYILN